jgi:hypothetical protein
VDPPPPYNAAAAAAADDDDDDEPFIIEKLGDLKATSRIDSHFTCAPKEISIDGIGEDEDKKKEFEEEKNEEKTPQQLVFTGENPEYLYINVKVGTDQKSFIEAAKEIRVYRDGIKHEDIDKVMLKYFNALCGGMDEYFKADLFIAKRQVIERDRKECSNMKRKRLFVDNAKREGKLKDTNKKHQHKKLLMPEVIYPKMSDVHYWLLQQAPLHF